MITRPLAAIAAILLAVSSAAQSDDAVPAKDYPGVGRITGYVAQVYEVKKFDALEFQLKDQTIHVEGRRIFTSYDCTPSPTLECDSPLGLQREFEAVIKHLGGAILVEDPANTAPNGHLIGRFGRNGQAVYLDMRPWNDGEGYDLTILEERDLAPSAAPSEAVPPKAQPAKVAPTPTRPNIPVSAAAQDKRIALVIGNADYKIGRLPNPTHDADDISRILKAEGFQVIDRRNASLPEMVNAVREFGERLLANDVGLVYYSGHALESKGRNYLIPVEAEIRGEDEIEYTAFDANRILDKMDTARKGVNILIIDACRDNPFSRSWRSLSRGLAKMDAPQGTLVAFSTSPGKTALDGEGRNSPYTKNLLQALATPGLPVEQVFKQVRRGVEQETKGEQTPWESTSLTGDFYFVR